MDAKAYLSQVKVLNERLRQTDREIAALRETYASLKSPWPDGQPHATGTSDPVGREAARVADQIMGLIEKQIRIRGQIWNKRSEILEKIGRVADDKMQQILARHYVEGNTLQDVAASMGFSSRQVYRIHKRALMRIREVLDNESKGM